MSLDKFTMPEGRETKNLRDDGYYQSPGISDEKANLLALELLRTFDGLPVSVIRQVLRQAEFCLGAVTVLDCGEATEFARAFEGFRRAVEQSR